MLFQADTQAIEVVQEQARHAPSYVVAYQLATTAFDLGILTIFLSIISFVRFLVGRRKSRV